MPVTRIELDNFTAFSKLALSDEWFELAQKMFDFTGDNVFVIGTVGEAPAVLLTNNDLRNVPTEFPVSNTDWKGNLMYWADQLWLDR